MIQAPEKDVYTTGYYMNPPAEIKIPTKIKTVAIFCIIKSFLGINEVTVLISLIC